MGLLCSRLPAPVRVRDRNTDLLSVGQARDYEAMDNPSLLRILVDMRGEETTDTPRPTKKIHRIHRIYHMAMTQMS